MQQGGQPRTVGLTWTATQCTCLHLQSKHTAISLFTRQLLYLNLRGKAGSSQNLTPTASKCAPQHSNGSRGMPLVKRLMVSAALQAFVYSSQYGG